MPLGRTCVLLVCLSLDLIVLLKFSAFALILPDYPSVRVGYWKFQVLCEWSTSPLSSVCFSFTCFDGVIRCVNVILSYCYIVEFPINI